jgi:hypothetical protein
VNTAPAKTAAFLCFFLIPLATFAQTASDSPVIASNASPSSSSVVASSALDLPDAPTPTGGQNTAPQQTNPQNQPQTQTPKQQQPQPGNAPTLGDLGFTPAQTLANAEMQRKLNQRTHDHKVHQTLGLVTVAPLCAAVIVSSGAKQKHDKATGAIIEPSSAALDLHAALGAATGALYGFTAYYAIAAPKIPGVKPKGAIKLHRDLVWIHAPGMVLTPILGGLALSQENAGQKVHGIASAHSYVAWTTVGAYGASIIAVSWPIHLKFWEK